MSDPRRAPPRIFSILSAAALGLAGAALVAMALIQAWQVFARYVLNDSPGWTEPVALLLMSLAVMLGAAVAVRHESHFAFQTLRDGMPASLRTAMKTLSRLIALATGGGLFALGLLLMADDWSVNMAGAPLPGGLKYAGLSIGGGLILLFALERLLFGDFQTPDGEH